MKNKIKKIVVFTIALQIFSFLFLLSGILPNITVVRAQTSDPFGEVKITPGADKWGKTAIVGFVNATIKFVIAVAGAWLLFKIILGGIKIISNTKDPAAFYEEIQKIGWTIFGLFLVASTYIIVGWVSKRIFGTDTYILDPVQNFQTEGDH